ncbi:hypothetical protein LENED_010188 [Lentinula edodes]|uniref:Uncharacterized protein n=2 Tax=Lentinula edodes TaxID=5353 RepID=A0A1Q3ELQ7_LENED|nr:hypothetical protein LENED_010188 [Lentinula edodes]
MFNLPLTIHGLYNKVPGITSFLPWKRPVTNLKTAKSLRKLARQNSVRNSQPLIRDPSIPRRGLPPLHPRKRAHPVPRQPSIVRQRAAALRVKRVEALRASNSRKKLPVAPPPPTNPVQQPVPKPIPRPAPGSHLGFKPEAAQAKLDAACDRAQRTGPLPRTYEDTVFVENMSKMNFQHRFLTEIFATRMRVEKAHDRIEERLRQQKEHEEKAKILRAKAKLQQQSQPPQPQPDQRQPYPQRPRPHLPPQQAANPPPMPSPLVFHVTPPQPSPKPPRQPPSESIRREWARQEEILQEHRARRAHQDRIAAGEIPPNTPLPQPLRPQWSLWEKARIGLDKVYQEVAEERKMREKKEREQREARRKQEEEAARAAWAQQAQARAEEERRRKYTAEQQEQARMKAEWEDKIRRETALAEELKKAEEDKARRRAQAARETGTAGIQRSASIPFIPPQTDDPELFHWEMYDRRWAAIRREGVEFVPFPLRFDQLPWPVFHFKPTSVITIDDLSEDDIRFFVLNTKRPGYEGKEAKERLRAELLRYHPDKFGARVLPYVLEVNEEREKVMEGAKRVTEVLYQLLKTLPSA